MRETSRPFGAMFLIETEPPQDSMARFTMASPRPVPPVSRERAVSGRKKGSQRRGMSFSGTPGP